MARCMFWFMLSTFHVVVWKTHTLSNHRHPWIGQYQKVWPEKDLNASKMRFNYKCSDSSKSIWRFVTSGFKKHLFNLIKLLSLTKYEFQKVYGYRLPTSINWNKLKKFPSTYFQLALTGSRSLRCSLVLFRKGLLLCQNTRHMDTKILLNVFCLINCSI